MGDSLKRKALWIESGIVFVSVWLFYLASLGENLSAAHDSIYYLNEIEHNSPGYFHPHHLLYHEAAGRWLHLFNSSIKSEWLIEVLNSLFGAGLITVFFRLLRDRFLFSKNQSAWASALPAFSYGVWAYSTLIEVYIIPLFFLLLAMYQLSKFGATSRTYAWAGFFHAWAILFHQSHILFFPAALFVLWRNRKSLSFSHSIIYYLFGLIPFTLLPYLFVMLDMGLQTSESMTSWLLGYATEDTYWNPPDLLTLPKMAIGFFRSFIGGHFLFGLPVNVFSESHHLVDGRYIVRDMPLIVRMLLVLSSLTIIAILAKKAWQGWRQWMLIPQDHSTIITLCISAFVCYAAFFSFWVPVNPEFWLPQMLFFWLVWLAAQQPANNRTPRIWKILATLLLVTNLAGSIYWMQDARHDYYRIKALSIAQEISPNDLLIAERDWRFSPFLSRYVDASVLGLSELYEKEGDQAGDWLSREIQKTIEAGYQVWITAEIIDWDRRILAPPVMDLTVWQPVWNRYRNTWEIIDNQTGQLFLLRNSHH